MNRKQTHPKSVTPNPRDRAAMASKLQLLNIALEAEDARLFWHAAALQQTRTPRRIATFYEGESGSKFYEGEGKKIFYGSDTSWVEGGISVQVPTDLPVATACATLERILREIRKGGAEVFASINKHDADRAAALRARFANAAPLAPDETPF